ncbi:MAG: hypothetical protein VX776_09880, partial [Planctomycetota bacterium]|nr:hypothetical protein [Planctomycetota bacterium]
MIYNIEMYEDNEALWIILGTVLKAMGWFCWLTALLWAVAGITCFPKLNSRLGFSLGVVVVSVLFMAAFVYEDRHILIYGVWGFDLLVFISLFCVRPRVDRNWAEDMKYSVQSEIENRIAIIRNVRDFSY